MDQELIDAKEKYHKIKKKNSGELHIPLCSLNDSSKYVLKEHEKKAYESNIFLHNKNNFEESKWKPKGEEDDTNCCIRNVPCPLIDFQLKKIKQLAESGRPWLETNLSKVIKNSKNSKEAFHDFRTYITNPNLSMLSPHHKIQLYRVGTFSTQPSCLNDEVQNDLYNGQAYLQKFKSFEYFSNNEPQLYGRSHRICKPLEFAISSNSLNEIATRYKNSLHATSLQEMQDKNELEDELSCEEEYKNKNDKTFDCKSNFDIIDESNDGECVSLNVDESNRNLVQDQNLENDDHNLETIVQQEQRMEEEDDEDENLSPVTEHIRKELRKISKQKSDETSALDFNENEAKTRSHYHDKTDYLGAGPSFRDIAPDHDPFFKRKGEEDDDNNPQTTTKQKPTTEGPTFVYKMSLGYSNPAQIDQLKKALFESSTVLLEGTREPTDDLRKLLKLLQQAHPIVKKKTATYEERKSEAIKEMIAANHPCVVHKLKIKCHDMDQIKKLEEALLDTSVIVFSCVSPTPKIPEASAPSVKMKVKERIKNIFNLGPLG